MTLTPTKTIELSNKQAEYVRNATHRWNFKIGATQCGKTHLDTLFLIPDRIIERIGKPGLVFIVGVSKGTIQRNVIEPLQELWGDLVSDISTDNTATMFGEKVYCIGAENIGMVRKFRGPRVKYLYIDEVVDINREVFELLKSRLSFEYSLGEGSGNPQGKNHWFKKFLESDADIYVQKYTIFDNPFLPKKYVEDLCKEYQGTVYYNRYILGQWCNAEGLIFQQIANDYKRYIAKKIQLNSVISIGIDWGGNKSKHSITATKISRSFNSIQCLKSDTMKATGSNTKQVFRWIINFIKEIQDLYGTVSFIFADSAEQVLNNSLQGELQSNGIDLIVQDSLKIAIKDRIELWNRLFNLEKISFIDNQTQTIIEALQTALFDETAKDDRWIDDGETSDIDSLDSFNYSFEFWADEISYSLREVA
ncbi:MAG: phage terminase large subunit [Clostridia bacterium]|nr:phage terminase large subunit [Clostridia bacterium]